MRRRGCRGTVTLPTPSACVGLVHRVGGSQRHGDRLAGSQRPAHARPWPARRRAGRRRSALDESERVTWTANGPAASRPRLRTTTLSAAPSAQAIRADVRGRPPVGLAADAAAPRAADAPCRRPSTSGSARRRGRRPARPGRSTRLVKMKPGTPVLAALSSAPAGERDAPSRRRAARWRSKRMAITAAPVAAASTPMNSAKRSAAIRSPVAQRGERWRRRTRAPWRRSADRAARSPARTAARRARGRGRRARDERTARPEHRAGRGVRLRLRAARSAR